MRRVHEAPCFCGCLLPVHRQRHHRLVDGHDQVPAAGARPRPCFSESFWSRVASTQVGGTSLLDAIDKDEFELVDAAELLSERYPLAIGAEATRVVEAAKEALGDGKALPVGAYTFNGWTRDDLIFLLVVSGNVDYVRIYSPKLGKYVSKLSSIGIVAGVNLTEAMRNSGISVPGSPPSTRTEARGHLQC